MSLNRNVLEYLQAQQGGGVKLTYLPFLIKALSIALKDFPEINATFSENQESVIQVVYEALSCKCMRPYATK
jgi:pyruvate/2-oxoglutarate dehydrogenase complex dihydrolipoamide acyltransferase (E2) component